MNTETGIQLETFLKQKFSNFILYLEKTIGVNNKLYPQVKQLENNIQGLINYAEYIVKVAVQNPSTKKYEIKEEIVVEYLENNGFKKIDLVEIDNNKFIITMKRYLEMFINIIC